MRRFLRGFAVFLLALFLALVVAVASFVLWLRTVGGHDFARRLVEGEINRSIRGRISAELVDGPVIGRLGATRVELRDDRGLVVARARHITVIYSLHGLLQHRMRIEGLEADGLEVHLGDFDEKHLGIGPVLAQFRQQSRSLDIDRVIVRDGRVWLRPYHGPVREVTGLDLEAELHSHDQARYGHVTIQRLVCRMLLERGPARPAHVRGAIVWYPSTIIDLVGVDVHGGRSRVVGDAHIGRARWDITLDELLVPYDEVWQIVPSWHPPADLHVRGAMHGPRGAIDGWVEARIPGGHLDVDGTLDLARGGIRGRAVLHGLSGVYAPTAPPVLLSADLALDARFGGGALEGDAIVRHLRGVIANVMIERGSLRAALWGKAVDVTDLAADVPGATVTGKAQLHGDGLAHAALRVAVTDLGKLLDAARGRVEVPPRHHDRDLVTLDVGVTRKPGQKKPEVTVRWSGVGEKTPRLSPRVPMP